MQRILALLLLALSSVSLAAAEAPVVVREILAFVMRGLTNKDIARTLSISPDAVKQHLGMICAKLGASNRTEAVSIALRRHLLKA